MQSSGGPHSNHHASNAQVINIRSESPDGLPHSPLLSADPQYATYPTPVVPPDAAGLSGEGLLDYRPSDGPTPSADEKARPWAHDPHFTGAPRSADAFRRSGADVRGFSSENDIPPTAVVRPWVPLPLRMWFWIPLVSLMAAGGIAFEVALHFSEKNQGVSYVGSVLLCAPC